MKAITTCLLSVLLTTVAGAVEYVTLTQNSLSKAVASTDLVEIVGYSGIADIDRRTVNLTFADGATTGILLQGLVTSNGGIESVNSVKGNQFTGLTSVSIVAGPGNSWALTLKITTRAELQEVTSGVVTIPGNTGTDYSVTMEKSTDLANWQPAAPGVYTASATPQFFRVRIAPAPSP